MNASRLSAAPARPPAISTAVAALALLGLAAATCAQAPRALVDGRQLQDTRLGPLRNLDGHFPYVPPATRADWKSRRSALRQRLQVVLGLWPMPTRTPLEPVIHGRVDKDGYTVEKVYFQSMPGFYVTGNLYRPTSESSGPRPGVLCPHGHWPEGRFYDMGPEAVAREIEAGAEKFEQGGRNPIQARCVHLARMGCVVFNYDMIGYADSQQIPQRIAHGFSEPRPEMHTATHWGLFSPQAEARYQHVMGLQTYNSIRALDFLCQLPDVDPTRLAVTGASGGGTQTFILAAVDDRPAVAFPAVMVSTRMQGGCTCENACGLRIGTGNVEIAGLFAPKPLGMTAANDWTRDMAEDGFPQLQQLYRLLGRPDHVQLTSLTQFGHNYNAPSRRSMYAWMHRHLHLAGELPEERDYDRLAGDALTVWDDQHPRPEGGPDLERRLLAWWHQDAQRQLAQPEPSPEALEDWIGVLRTGIQAVVGRGLPGPQQVEWIQTGESAGQGVRQRVGLATYHPDRQQQEQVPVVILEPISGTQGAVVWVSEQGKQGLWRESGELRQPVRRLLEAGYAVISPDLLGQGESAATWDDPDTTRRVDNPRAFAGYTFGYNPSLFAQRVHDVLTTWALAEQRVGVGGTVAIVGRRGAGKWVAAARAVADRPNQPAVIQTGGFRFAEINRWDHPDFLPGGAKYADIAGMLAVAAPSPVCVQGLHPADRDCVQTTYQGLGRADRLAAADVRPMTWLLEQLQAGGS